MSHYADPEIMERPLTIKETMEMLHIRSRESFRKARMPGGPLARLKPVSYSHRLFPRKVVLALRDGKSFEEIESGLQAANAACESDEISAALRNG